MPVAKYDCECKFNVSNVVNVSKVHIQDIEDGEGNKNNSITITMVYYNKTRYVYYNYNGG